MSSPIPPEYIEASRAQACAASGTGMCCLWYCLNMVHSGPPRGLAMGGPVARIDTSPLNGMPRTSQHGEVGRHVPNKMDSNAVQDAAGGVMGRSCVCPAALQPGIPNGESLTIPGEDMPDICSMSSCKATNSLLFCHSFPGLIGTKAMRLCPSKR